MTQSRPNSHHNPRLYIPASMSEINDQLFVMAFQAPTFIDRTGVFPERNINSMFYTLVEGLRGVRRKLGEDSYAALIDLAERAKALFAADQDDTNGKTTEGCALLLEMQDLLTTVRSGRVKARHPDEDGEITGD